MKKIFTTLFIALGFCTVTFAQNRNTVEFGAGIGYNSSYVTDANSNLNSSAIGGLNVGVSADYYFSRTWSLKLKVIYDQKGWGDGFLSDDQGNEIDGVNFKLNYVTIPVLANWHFGRTGNWYLDFGPYVGFLTSATANGIDVKDSFNSTDGGVDLGIGVKIPISDKAKFFIEYEGQGGVSNIFKDTSDGSSLQNIRESFNVGINF